MPKRILRPDVTTAGTRNFEKLVCLAARLPGDKSATKQMADAFAAVISDVTPAHREVLSSTMAHSGIAPGRSRHWVFPPGLTGGLPARRKWVSLVLVDCIDAVSDQLAADHCLAERQDWTRRLRLYLEGADGYPVDVI